MKAKRYLTLFAVLTLLAPLPFLRASGSDDTSTKQDDKGSNSGKDSTSDKTDDKGGTTTESSKDRGDGDHNAVPETETDVIRDKLKEFEAAKEAAKLARKTLVEKLDAAKTAQERKDILDQLKEVEKLHDKEQRELAKQVREELKRDRRNRRTH